MFFHKFDFGLNMRIMIVTAVSFISLFTGWSLLHLVQGKRPHAKWALLACVMSAGASLLEVKDFPPIFNLIDAHALWHLATIPIVLVWYKFYAKDANYDLGIQQNGNAVHPAKE
jgi:hypothetical protein